MLDELIQDEVLPESYLKQLHAQILKHKKEIYDMEPGDGELESKPHVLANVRISFLLFALRVITFEVAENMRREGLPKLSSKMFQFIRDIEGISRSFDNSYRRELKTIHSPAISTLFWNGRESDPVEAARMLISEAYL